MTRSSSGLWLGVPLCGLALLTFSVPLAAADRSQAELAGAALSIEREAGTEECRDANAIAAALSGWVEAPDRPARQLAIDVTLRASGAQKSAEISVNGAEHGRRTLESTAPGCDDLETLLVAALAVILDLREAQAPRPSDEASPSPAPAAKEDEPPQKPPAPPAHNPPHAPSAATTRPRVEPATRRALTLALFAGGGVSLGLADRALLFGSASGWLRSDWFGLGLELFATPNRTRDYGGGSVDVRWLGSLSHGCLALGGARELSVLACGTFGAALLRGEGNHYLAGVPPTYQPWFALGATAILRGPLGDIFQYSAQVSAFAPLEQQTFSIRDAGQAFATPQGGVFLGLGLGATIW
ncbi:MAG TPA: hypothetical protein VGM29_15595 [Polyangiaceae bacterium]